MAKVTLNHAFETMSGKLCRKGTTYVALNKQTGKMYTAEYHARFVDDFLLMCTDKALLKQLVKDARAFLANELGITLHTEKYHFQCASHGFAFVGAYLKNGRIYSSVRKTHKVKNISSHFTLTC